MDKYQKSLKERADSGDKSAEDLLIHSYVESLLEPIMPMIAMRVKTIMEEVFDQTRNKYAPTIRTDNSAVIAELERQIHTMSIACRQDAMKLNALREENERLRKALLYIAYEHVLAPPGMAENHFRQTAREALAISKMETTTGEGGE